MFTSLITVSLLAILTETQGRTRETSCFSFFLSYFYSIISQFNLKGLEPGYHVGRISEGQFEYDRLNDWMTPR